MMNGHARIRQAMRQNEQDVLNCLRRNGGHAPLLMSVAWHNAFGRLSAAKMIRYRRKPNSWTGRYIVRPYARPVTPLVK